MKNMLKHIRIIVAAILAILVLIVVLQNLETVETPILFWTIPMPRAVLIFVAMLMGFAAGILTAGWLRRNKKKEK